MPLGCQKIKIEGHALQRMFERNIALGDLVEAVRRGEIIKAYLQDKPFPSYLLLTFVIHRPLHAVVAVDQDNDTCFVITVYEPDPLLWHPDFKNKR